MPDVFQSTDSSKNLACSPTDSTLAVLSFAISHFELALYVFCPMLSFASSFLADVLLIANSFLLLLLY
jgi:hypothetical protein